MAFTLASSGGAGPGSGTSQTLTGITASAGNMIVLNGLGVMTGNNSVTLSSVTDNTAGGNTYTSIPQVASGAFFGTANQFSAQVTVYCLVVNALSSNSITLTWSASTAVLLAEWSVWSGVPAGTTVLATALTANILAAKASQNVPAVSAAGGALCIAMVNLDGAISSVTNSYAILTPENFSAWLVPAGPGSKSTTATFAGTSNVWAASNVAFGPLAPPRPRVTLAAVSRAASW